jgi:hypothetical protein
MKKSDNVIGSSVLSNRFDYVSAWKTFIAEISELSHGGVDPLGQLYNDSCDQGFVMISSKTGSEVEFYLHETQRDGEGEIGAWEFRATANAIHHNFNLQNVKVIILND